MTVGARPAPVRIDDLADPRFSPETAEILTAMAAMAEGVRLEPDALMEEAVAKTGLSDFHRLWPAPRGREPAGFRRVEFCGA